MSSAPATAAPLSPIAEPKTGAAVLSRELADLLVELSIAMHKHAIYPPGHPLLEGAVDAVARKLWGLLVDRPSQQPGQDHGVSQAAHREKLGDALEQGQYKRLEQ